MHKKQVLYSGDSVASDIEKLLKKDSPKKIFLVTGNNSYKESGVEEYFSNIFKKYSCIRFYNFTENPKIEDVEMGIRLFKQNNCDYVIAIGGGSVIDMAKLINIGQANVNDLKSLILENKKIEQPGKKLIAIPTTSGAGSEATHFAVIYIDSIKYSLAHKEYILPDIVFLIPKLTYSLNKYQTAVSGIDALSQAIESYWSVNSNSESKIFSKNAIKIILENLPKVINKGDLMARDRMLLASYRAGQAINITMTTGPHAMAYTFTSKFNIPHGHAVALTLASWFDFNANATDFNTVDKRGASYVKGTIKNLSQYFNKIGNINDSTPQKIKSLLSEIGLETKLSNLNIRKSDIDSLVNGINLIRLSNNPCKITKLEISELLHEIY
jgi:alcohol dehydrogenase class IV